MYLHRKAKSLVGFISLTAGVLLLSATAGWAWQSQVPELCKEWEKMLGYKAPDVVGKVAPDVKSGMTIDSSNYKQYPGLKDLLPPALYDRLDAASYAPLAPIKIVDTVQYHNSPGFLKKSLANRETCKFAEDGLTLVGYQGGFPFAPPKNGTELAMIDDNGYLGDSFLMKPMRLRLFNRKNQPEREMRQDLGFFRYFGCTDWNKDTDPNPEQLHYFSAGVFIYPKDVSGAAYSRRRFLPADKPDEFLLYIPSMRRIRRMGGRDTQDPLFGSDLVWDDFNMWWQKISTTDFPNEYKMEPMREMLLPTFISYNYPDDRYKAGFTDYLVDDKGDQAYVRFGSWQRRPVWPLEVISKDPNYMYGRRLIMDCAETGMALQCQMFDWKGRLWRSWVRDYDLSEKGEGVMEDIIDIVDHLNTHRTVLDFKGYFNPRFMGPEYGDVRFLTKKAK